jgi:dipeptidyl aminopeptidase/acylaminoacyl peptidase
MTNAFTRFCLFANFMSLLSSAVGAQSGGKSPMTIRQALEVRRPTSISISGDGQLIAYTVSQARLQGNTYHSTLNVVATNGGTPRELASGEHIAAAQWSPDGKTIYYLSRVNRLFQAWSVSANGGKPRQLTNHPVGIATSIERDYIDYAKPFKVSPDGKRATFVAYDTIAAFRSYLAGRDTSFRYTGDMYAVTVQATAPEFTWRAAPEAAAEIWMLHLESGRTHRAWKSPWGPTLWPIPPEPFWSPDGSQVAILPFANDGAILRAPLVLLSGSKLEKSHTPFPKMGHTLDLVWDDDSRGMTFTSQGILNTGMEKVQGYESYHYSIGSESLTKSKGKGAGSLAAQLPMELRKARGDSVHDCVIARQASRAACIRETPMTPPEIATAAVLNGKPSGRVQVLTHLNPELDRIALGKISDLHWSRSKTDSGTSGLILPVGYTPGKRYPVVIMMYNLFKADRFYSDAAFSSYAAQPFASHGYAVVLMNTPYYTFDYAPAAYDSARSREGEGMARAARAIIDTLNARGIADTKRIGMMGWSFGGFWTPYIITHYPTLVQAAAIGDAGNHQTSIWWMGNDAGRAQETRFFGGGPYDPKYAARWREVSPIENIEKMQTPLLMEYSGAYLMGIELWRRAVDAGKAAELHIYPTEAHVFERPANRYSSMMRHYDWFNFWLLGEVDRSAGKREQYDRWNRMKMTKTPAGKILRR